MGIGACTSCCVARAGQINMKRVRRLYRLEGLQLRHRLRRRKHASLHRGVPPAASRAHE
jgi:putative transposase